MMRGVRTHRRRRSPRSLRPLVAALVLAVGLLSAWAFAGITIRENALARLTSQTQAQIAAEERRRTTLEASVAQKRTEDYVAERARSLGWAWPWEAIIAVEQERAARNEATPEEARPSRVQRWVALLLGAGS